MEKSVAVFLRAKSNEEDSMVAKASIIKNYEKADASGRKMIFTDSSLMNRVCEKISSCRMLSVPHVSRHSARQEREHKVLYEQSSSVVKMCLHRPESAEYR